MSKKISLKQFLMKTGKFEKAYECIRAIRDGKISINNEVVTNPNYFFNPKKALAKFNNEKVKPVAKLYFILNKPAGCLCQKYENEKTIYDILEKLNIPDGAKKSLFAVGRLDKESEGLLILTNDGKLSSSTADPKNSIIKKYFAILENPADKSKMNLLERGVEIEIGYEKYKTKPCRIKVAGRREIYISISEGKKRQIRKMLDAIGNKVVYLKRVSIGGLQLGNLKAGEIKQMAREEIYDKLNIQ